MGYFRRLSLAPAYFQYFLTGPERPFLRVLSTPDFALPQCAGRGGDVFRKPTLIRRQRFPHPRDLPQSLYYSER